MPTNANAETPNRRRLWQMIGATGILLIPLLVIWWPGCRQYPAVTSKESLGLMKLLYAAWPRPLLPWPITRVFPHTPTPSPIDSPLEIIHEFITRNIESRPHYCHEGTR